MNILYTAFNGKNNSSKILLDRIDGNNKLYLRNSFITSVDSLKKELLKNNYDLIICFGEAYLSIDTIKIELVGKKDMMVYKTNFDYSYLVSKLKNDNYKVMVSEDAGNYLCNNLYYNGLKYLSDNNMNIKMIFIHIPKMINISDIDKLAGVFKG